MKVRDLLGLLLIASMAFAFIGCGGEEKTTPPPQTQTPAVEDEPAAGSFIENTEIPPDAGEHAQDWAEIMAMVDDVITRLSYKDRSGLYENEFPYLRAQEKFDNYIKRGEVVWANTDSLDYIEIKNITFFNRDSALVEAVFHNINENPKEPAATMPLMAYYWDGRWIRPYVSTINHQLEYDELIRQADEDSKDEW